MTDPDLTVSIRDLILADATITALLAQYKGQPAVFTRAPIPADATYPVITVSRNTNQVNEDGVDDYRPVVTYQLASHGLNSSPPADYRNISTVAYRLRTMFHGQRNLTLTDWAIIDQRCTGPVDFPSAAQTTTRAVNLIVRLAQLSPRDMLLMAGGGNSAILMAGGDDTEFIKVAHG